MTILDSPGAPDTGIDALALGTAVARVRETSSDQPLFTDRYSQMLVDAAGPMEPDQAALAVPDYVAARTKWFDDFFLAASAAGLAQIGATEPTKRIITGAVIVIAVVLDTYRSQRASRRG